MTARILVLGGRLSGLTFAYNLRRLLGDTVTIKLIERNQATHFRPSIPHIALGIREPEEIAVDLAKALTLKGIEFEQANVTKIVPEEDKIAVERKDGTTAEENYDYLVIALGAHLGKERVKGSEKNAFSVCEISDVLKLRERLTNFKGGNITLGSGIFYQGSSPKPKMPENYYPRVDSACEGPIFEMSLMLHGLLKKTGVLNKTKITIFAPGEFLSDLSLANRKIVKDLYGQLGYDLVERFVLKEYTEDSVISESGNSLKSDLSIYKPPYEGRSVLKQLAGDLADDGGFVPTDMNMVSVKYSNVYAVGDANAGAVPKLGFLAVRMGAIAAQHLANQLGANVPVEKFYPTIVCIADNPFEGYGVAVTDDTLFGGSVSKAEPSPVNHLKKELLTKYYMWTRGDMVLEKYFGSW
jgi:sulfide:quinone oxidoreductase